MTHTKKSILLISWAAVAAVAIAIFLFSAQNSQESTQVSHGLIERIYLWYTNLFGRPCTSGELIRISAFWDHFVRKLAHFSIYTLLGLCSANAFYLTFLQLKKAVGLALLTGCLYAVSDEIHQLFVPGRSCQITDMALDSCGVLLGILLFCALFAAITKRRSSHI